MVTLAKTNFLESGGGSRVVVLAKIDTCGVCGKNAKVNRVRCKTCNKWVHAWCANKKRVFFLR